MIRKTLALAIFALAAHSASADLIRYETVLAPEAPGASGSGTADFVFDTIGRTLQVDATWSGLSAPTTVAHIHCCLLPTSSTIGVAVTPVTLPSFPTGLTSGSYSQLINLADAASFTASFVNNFGGGTNAGAQVALLAGMTDGRAYFNIHTEVFPGGEIRGFIRAKTVTGTVPEPSGLALAGLALASMLAVARRRRAS